MRTPCQSDPELWVSDTAAFRHEAMKLCRDCPIIAECLAGAIERREKFAVWGGRDFSHATTRPNLPPPPPKPIAHDGVAVTVKACIDGLRDVGVIPGDDVRFIPELTLRHGGQWADATVVLTFHPIEGDAA